MANDYHAITQKRPPQTPQPRRALPLRPPPPSYPRWSPSSGSPSCSRSPPAPDLSSWPLASASPASPSAPRSDHQKRGERTGMGDTTTVIVLDTYDVDDSVYPASANAHPHAKQKQENIPASSRRAPPTSTGTSAPAPWSAAAPAPPPPAACTRRYRTCPPLPRARGSSGRRGCRGRRTRRRGWPAVRCRRRRHLGTLVWLLVRGKGRVQSEHWSQRQRFHCAYRPALSARHWPGFR